MWLFLACSTAEPTFPVTGTVVEVRGGGAELVVAHDPIPGFMDAMTMPFDVADPPQAANVRRGDTIAATLIVGGESGTRLDAITVTAPAPPEQPPALAPGESVPVGALFPATDVMLAEGPPVTIGQGQAGTFAVTFFYTTCPLPEYCPLVVSRLQALQPALPPGARILAITLDPESDSRGTLRAFGAEKGAIPGKWDLGRVPPEVLVGLAEKAGMKVEGKVSIGIVHDLVLLILDRDGRLVRRYTDMSWDQSEVVELLR